MQLAKRVSDATVGLLCALALGMAGCTATNGTSAPVNATQATNQTVDVTAANETTPDDTTLWYTNAYFGIQARLPEGFVEADGKDATSKGESCELYAANEKTHQTVAVFLRDKAPDDVEAWMAEHEQQVDKDVELSKRTKITLGGASCVGFSYEEEGDNASKACEQFFMTKDGHGLRIELSSGDKDDLVTLEDCFANYQAE